VPWWRRRWPQSLVRETESSWELAAHCRGRTQLYHTLLHYKFRLLLKIKELLLQREGLHGTVEDLHRRLDLLLDDCNSKFLQTELGRLKAVLQQAMVRWGSKEESMAVADVWGDGESKEIPQPAIRRQQPKAQSQGSLTGWLSGQSHARKKHCR